MPRRITTTRRAIARVASPRRATTCVAPSTCVAAHAPYGGCNITASSALGRFVPTRRAAACAPPLVTAPTSAARLNASSFPDARRPTHYPTRCSSSRHSRSRHHPLTHQHRPNWASSPSNRASSSPFTFTSAPSWMDARPAPLSNSPSRSSLFNLSCSNQDSEITKKSSRLNTAVPRQR